MYTYTPEMTLQKRETKPHRKELVWAIKRERERERETGHQPVFWSFTNGRCCQISISLRGAGAKRLPTHRTFFWVHTMNVTGSCRIPATAPPSCSRFVPGLSQRSLVCKSHQLVFLSSLSVHMMGRMASNFHQVRGRLLHRKHFQGAHNSQGEGLQ